MTPPQTQAAGAKPEVTARSGADGEDSDARLDQLWLETLGRIASRAAHEIKGALNGVSVNLEVVRSRASRPDAQASAVQRYAESAAEQLEALVRLSEAMLALARPVRAPLDVVVVLRRVSALLGPATAAEGGVLEELQMPPVPEVGTSDTLTVAPANAVRVAIGAVLLEAIEAKGRVTCTVEAGEQIRLVTEGSAGAALQLPQQLVDALAGAGIGVSAQARVVSLMFPRVARQASITDRG